MDLGDYVDNTTDDVEHVLRVFTKHKDELLEEQNDELELLHARIYDLRRRTTRVDVGLTHDVADVENKVDALQTELIDFKDDLLDQKARLAESAALVSQHDKTLEKLLEVNNELEQTLSELRDIELKRKKYSAYYADKCTLHLQHAYEGRGLYSNTTFNESIGEQVERMNVTAEQKVHILGTYKAANVYAEAFSFSASSVATSFEYVRHVNGVPVYTLYVNVRENDMLFILTQESARVERALPFSNEYGEIVYSVLMQVDVSPQMEGRKLVYRVRKGRITLYSDKNLLSRAYSGESTHYDVQDELLSRGFPMGVQLEAFLESKYLGDSVPVYAIVARGTFPSTEKYTAAVHHASKLYTEMLHSLMMFKADKERNDTMRRLNDETYRSENVLVSLLSDVNSLKTSTVRRVTAHLSVEQVDIAVNPMMKPFVLQPKSTLPSLPDGDAWDWWKHSDPYLMRREAFDVQYEMTKATPESSQALIAKVVHPGINTSKTLHVNGRMYMHCQPAEDTLHYFVSTTGRTMFDYFIHVPYGRDEIGSSNDNESIFHMISYEPQHTGDKADLYYGIMITENAQPTLRLKYYVSDALPTSSKIIDSRNLRVYVQGKFVTCPTVWDTYVEKDHSIERLVLTAVVDISEVFAKELSRGYVPLARIRTTEGHAGAHVSLSRKWRNEGRLTSDSTIQLSNDIAMKMSVLVDGPAGGHSIAKRVCKHLVVDGNLPTIPSEYLKPNKYFDERSVLMSEAGWLAFQGHKVSILQSDNVVMFEYLTDPINVGGVSYVDYAVNSMEIRFESIVAQISDLHDLITDVSKRLSYIERAYNDRHSFISGVLPMLAVATSTFNPLLGVVVSIIAEAVSLTEMVEKGVTVESVTYVLTNLLDVLAAIAVVRGARHGWISENARYDVINATADAQKQVMNVRLSEFVHKERVLENSRLLQTHNVQIMHRPIEDFKFGSYYANILEKMSKGTATKKEVAIFNATSSVKLNPTHQYMRMSNVKRVDGDLYKDVWIFGVGDGYSKMVDRSWVGWGNVAFAPRKTQGELSPGVMKMVFKKGANDVTWEVMPHRSSGMTNVEILTAGGMIEPAAVKYVAESDPAMLNDEVAKAYDRLVEYYMHNSKAMAVQEKKIQLFDGQLDALHDVMKGASYDTYTYSLVGNNCQHFVDSTLTLLQSHTKKPDWMSEKHYAEYIRKLDSIFAKYTH